MHKSPQLKVASLSHKIISGAGLSYQINTL